jgi:type II secretory pathway pseudopilin PulG
MNKTIGVLVVVIIVVGILFVSAVGKLSSYKDEIDRLKSELRETKYNAIVQKPKDGTEGTWEFFEKLQGEISHLRDEVRILGEEFKKTQGQEVASIKNEPRESATSPSSKENNKSIPDSSEVDKDPRITEIEKAKKAIAEGYKNLNTINELKGSVSEKEYMDAILKELVKAYKLTPSEKSEFARLLEIYLPQIKEAYKTVSSNRDEFRNLMEKYNHDWDKVRQSKEWSELQTRRQNIQKEYDTQRSLMLTDIKTNVFSKKEGIYQKEFERRFDDLLEKFDAGSDRRRPPFMPPLR